MAIAIFDLDNTLLNGDSDHAWGVFLCRKGIVDADLYRAMNNRFYELYKLGRMDIYEFLNFALRPLAENRPEELNAWHKEFMRDVIEPMMLPKAQSLIQSHRNAGDLIMIITATNRFVTGPIGERLGVDVMLATEPEIKEGRYTGQVEGVPCYQEGKVKRLNNWLEKNSADMTGSSFYSDSINDLPLLELVDKPVAVNPDDKLNEIALERGWPVLDLRG